MGQPMIATMQTLHYQVVSQPLPVSWRPILSIEKWWTVLLCNDSSEDTGKMEDSIAG